MIQGIPAFPDSPLSSPDGPEEDPGHPGAGEAAAPEGAERPEPIPQEIGERPDPKSQEKQDTAQPGRAGSAGGSETAGRAPGSTGIHRESIPQGSGIHRKCAGIGNAQGLGINSTGNPWGSHSDQESTGIGNQFHRDQECAGIGNPQGTHRESTGNGNVQGLGINSPGIGNSIGNLTPHWDWGSHPPAGLGIPFGNFLGNFTGNSVGK